MRRFIVKTSIWNNSNLYKSCYILNTKIKAITTIYPDECQFCRNSAVTCNKLIVSFLVKGEMQDSLQIHRQKCYKCLHTYFITIDQYLNVVQLARLCIDTRCNPHLLVSFDKVVIHFVSSKIASFIRQLRQPSGIYISCLQCVPNVDLHLQKSSSVKTNNTH